ncbi:unnamed protein product [Rotaria sp. Silwood2]|nr:unnamed protein product [Rotaria sp. Silwood2]
MPCEYIFTHDDDLIFRIKQQFHVPKVSLPNLLINILKTYRPAIASFPWSTGDKSILAMRELALVYENETIAPLTGFDNGMVIYHKSIANFFIPFSPRGEGGFKGDWTLCAHFLQMFAHLLFEKYAIRLNMFEYNNSINMDNSLPENHFKQRILIKNGLAYVRRNHVPTYINGTLQYLYSTKTLLSKKGPFFSMVLMAGLVFHRQYLYQYTYKLPQIARDLVESLINCEDILFNFLLANTTKQGPVVIDAWAKPYDFGGLWKRRTHAASRSLCINKFVEIFGGMPLKYTTSIFKINRNQTVPGKNKHFFQEQFPIK